MDRQAGVGTAGSNGSMGWYIEEKEEHATKITFYSALRETLVKLANQRNAYYNSRCYGPTLPPSHIWQKLAGCLIREENSVRGFRPPCPIRPR
jgi:hypothetical protein